MNKYCEKIKPLLSEYVDGGLDARRARDLESHLSGCESCKELVESFRANKSLLASLPLRQTSTGFDAALAGRIAALAHPPRQRSWLADLAQSIWPANNALRPVMTMVAAAGFVFAMAFIGPVLFVPHETDQTQADSALIAHCVEQHGNYVEAQPLADSSAQALAGQIDSTNADTQAAEESF
jgi:anti-sigma factor RsiW